MSYDETDLVLSFPAGRNRRKSQRSRRTVSRRLVGALIVLASALMLCVQSSLAQTVRGRVIEAGIGQPLRGVFVVVIDTTGTQQGAVLTDSMGRYVIPISRGGKVAVRAELIGHRTYESGYFDATAGAIEDIALVVEAIVIEAVEANATQRCITRPESAEQTMRLWHEAAKALKVAAWAEKEQTFQTYASSYTRMLDPHTLAIID
ncbi:MAG: carboxypeptidase-like regulatory domain-containing protein, partial [Gemmatimonadota bacterium]